LLSFEQHGAVLGLTQTGLRVTIPAKLPVQRCRRGNHCAEELLLLGPAQAGIAAWPKPLLAGVLKAVGRALDDARAGAPPSLPYWWLACQLALSGTVRRAEWKARWRTIEDKRPELGPRILRLGPYLVWHEHLLLLRDGLEQKLLKGKRNPLLTELTPATVSALAGADEEHIAPRVISLLAEKHGLVVVERSGAPVLELSGDLAPPPAHGTDLRVADEIVALFENDEGLSRAMLAKRYPAHKHVIHWLFASGILVDTGSGYVFTREQLRSILAALEERGLNIAEASTGVLRKDLGLKRPAAEALRAYLMKRYDISATETGDLAEEDDG
jgi:hypothetical protein